jgi:gas vesicle protein
MNRHPQENHYPGFLFGLVTGAALGAGLAMYFAPKTGSEIRKRVAASTKDLGDTASEYYEQLSTRVVDAVEELTSRGKKARDAAAGVVARGAHEVARSAHEVARGAHEVERFADHAAKAAGKY